MVKAGRCGGLERSEFDCGLIGDAALPETLDGGLDIVVVVIGNTGECGKSVSLTFDNRNGCTRCWVPKDLSAMPAVAEARSAKR